MRNLMKQGFAAVSVALLILGLVVLPACKSGEKTAEEMAKNAIEKATGGKANVDIKGGSVKVKTEGGEVSWGEAAAWPEDLPSDVPKFTYGKVTGVVRATSADGKHWTLALAEVEAEGMSQYIETLKTAGWSIVMDARSAEGGTVIAEKGKFNLTLGYSESGKTGSLYATEKAQ
jgi:hypothetical protein